jgi:HPt (histidine-containing phosphotransfer) domain-containing protein
MNENIFPDHLDLDTEFLNSTYSDDAETAAMMFENYLQELPENLKLLEDSYNNQDIQSFRQLIHKQKPSFSYVGLTDITDKFQQLQIKCQQVDDLLTYKEEIQYAFSRIRSSTPLIQSTLERLRAA